MYVFVKGASYRIIEAIVVALAGIVASYNFQLAEETIEVVVAEIRSNVHESTDLISAAQFNNNLFMVLNVLSFWFAIFLLAWKEDPEL